MELNKELISKIASDYGVTAEDFTAKITSEKAQELKLPGQLFTDDELSTRDSSKYTEGKDAGVEMNVKDLKKTYGYDFEGKDINSFMSHHNEQLKGKYSKEPNARVEELESDLKRQKTTFEEEITGYKSQLDDFKGKYRGETIKNTLLSIMPKETTIKPDAIVTLFKSDYQVDIEEGAMVVKKNGVTLKDPKTSTPLEVGKVFNEYVQKEGFVKVAPGRGGGNEFGGQGYTAKTPQEFQKQWVDKNPDKSVNSPDYQKDYAEFRKESA